MVDTSFQFPTLFALALLSVNAPQAGPLDIGERPVSQALQRGTRLDVLLVPGAEHRFRVRREARGAAPIGAAVPDRCGARDAPAAAVECSLDLTLAVERSGRGRERVLTATLQPERGGSIVYYVLIDQGAVVDRLRRHRSSDEPAAAMAEEPTEAEVRRYVELALGSGLHGRRLEKGALYALGEADAPQSSVREAVFAPKREERAPLDELSLQFQGIGVGGAAQVARFGLALPDVRGDATASAAHGRTIDPDTDRVLIPAGDASYSLADGLLSRLSYRPSPAVTGPDEEPAPAAWLEIERILD